MRLLALLALLLATVALAAGCGGSSSAQGPTTTSTAPPPPAATSQSPPAPPPPPAKPSRIYTKKELARLVLQPKDSPADMRYVRSESGHRTLAQIGFILPSQIRELRSYGFRSVRDAVFAAKSPKSDRVVAERVWLMRNPKSASRWLAKSRGDSINLGFSQLAPSAVGDESWAATGQANGQVVITHAFRLGNAVFVVASYSAKEALSSAAARAAAVAAFTRARNA